MDGNGSFSQSGWGGTVLLRLPSLDTSRENFLCVAGAFALGVLDGIGNGGREEGGGGGSGSCSGRKSWCVGGGIKEACCCCC